MNLNLKTIPCTLLAVIFLLPVFSFSQKPSTYKKKHFTFYIEKQDTSLAFEVCAHAPSVLTNEKSSYAWYDEGRILETKGGFSGRLLDGRYTSYFGNKNLKERGAYVKGRKEGKWMKWHPNGRINEISYWRMGMKQGKYVVYNDVGQKMLYARFKRDKLNGTLVSYEKDKILSKTKYRNGTEVLPKLLRTEAKPSAEVKNKKPSFLKSFFRKKDKSNEKPPAKDKKKKDVSMSSN